VPAHGGDLRKKGDKEMGANDLFKGMTFTNARPALHLGELVDRRLNESGMTKAEFGRRIGTSRQNINTLIRKPTLTTEQLMDICVVMKFDLFAVLSEALHQAVPDCQTPIPRTPAPTYTHAYQLSAELVRAALAVVNCALPPPS
jgi:Cro/C1-type HTH DNA-binding domain